MAWYVYALLSAFLHAVFGVFVKTKTKSIDKYVLGAGTYLVASAFLLLVSLYKGIPSFGENFFPSIATTAMLNVVAFIFFYKALEESDVSIVMPMLSFTPVFLILTSLLILGEFPSRTGLAGIFLVVIGSYILNSEKEGSLLQPFKNMKEDKGVLYGLLVALIFSVSANYDKIAMKNSNPYFAFFAISLLIGTCFAALSFAKKFPVREATKEVPGMALIGVVLALSAVFNLIAFTDQIVPYVISIKRFSGVFSVLLGYMVFKEKQFSKRMMGALIMVAGALIIILYS